LDGIDFGKIESALTAKPRSESLNVNGILVPIVSLIVQNENQVSQYIELLAIEALRNNLTSISTDNLEQLV
jgi:hypothetical protein